MLWSDGRHSESPLLVCCCIHTIESYHFYCVFFVHAVSALERTILDVFFAVTNGKSWKRSDYWTTQKSRKHWYGLSIVEMGRNQHVSGLELADNNLDGSYSLQELTIALFQKSSVGLYSLLQDDYLQQLGTLRNSLFWT